MFKTIEQGLRAYKKEAREYFKRLEELKNKYGNDDVFRLWDDVHYLWAREGTAKLRGMERVLGLSEEEVEQMEKEIKASL